MKQITKFLYWKSPLSLLIHFGLNLLLAYLVAQLFATKLHADALMAKKILFISRLVFIAYSVATVKGIKTFDGYLVDFFWTNTHVVAKNGLWPQYLYPIFKFEKDEHVSFEKTDIVIEEYLSSDSKNLKFKVKGSIRWELGPAEADAAKFTETSERFYAILSQKGKIASDSVVKRENYRLTTSKLRDSELFNQDVITKMDPTLVLSEFGVVLKESIISVEETDETSKILTIETKGQEYLKQVQDYMTQTGCTFAEAKNAVDSAVNGATVINLSGGGMPILNMGGFPPTRP